MSLLTCIQHFCERTNLPSPATVMGTTDTQVLQARALLEEIGIDANSRHTWARTTFEKTHTTTAATDQGPMTTIAGAGWSYVKNMTIWDRSTTLPVLGPLDSMEWQALVAVIVTGPRFQFRIQNGHLLVNPVPTAGDTWAFEYQSKYWILGADGVTYKQYFTLDTDTLLLPEELMLQGLRAWWKREKGLDYAEDMRMYETQLKDAASRDGGKPTLFMDRTGWNGPAPGIWVPDGNWPL
jgi:hypothetical protein